MTVTTIEVRAEQRVLSATAVPSVDSTSDATASPGRGVGAGAASLTQPTRRDSGPVISITSTLVT